MMPQVDQDSKSNRTMPAEDDLPDDDNGKGYKWYEMGFFTHWKRGGCCRVMCIDTPERLQSGLRTSLQSRPSGPGIPEIPNFCDPFALHTDLLDQIIQLYDVSVWRVRDPVRKVEKARETIKRERAERKKRSADEVRIRHSNRIQSRILESVLP